MEWGRGRGAARLLLQLLGPFFGGSSEVFHDVVVVVVVVNSMDGQWGGADAFVEGVGGSARAWARWERERVEGEGAAAAAAAAAAAIAQADDER